MVESPRPVPMDKLHWPYLECVRSEDSGVGTDIGVHVSCTPSPHLRLHPNPHSHLETLCFVPSSSATFLRRSWVLAYIEETQTQIGKKKKEQTYHMLSDQQTCEEGLINMVIRGL